MFLWFPVLDLARAPRRTARKKGSGYENGIDQNTVILGVLQPRPRQSRTQSNACARARMALALGKLNFSCAVIGLTCMPTKPEPLI